VTPLLPQQRLRLAPRARLQRDRQTGGQVLLYPEAGLILDEVAARVVARLASGPTLETLIAELAQEHGGADRTTVERDTVAFLDELRRRGLLLLEEPS
jgi:coenzyme PQQ biosynthesis protein PqqD